ncbi:MAG: ribonuclease D [Rhodospirillaceae bacterium]|nr:ribonuclease D [Rhodospirillaceae bacterium]
MTFISDNKSLREFCEKVSTSSDYITVDTEFIRERTYWSELCLIQIGGKECAAAIDTMAPGIDLAPVFNLMLNNSVTKVFHAARQDFEIFSQLMGKLPTPVFDTQISAMVCGYGDSIGYDALVKSLTKERIDKSMRYTDWRRRPLSKKQLEYALSDVTHLRVVYEKLRKTLAENGRADWVAEEMETLTNNATYYPDPMEAWRRLKIRSTKPRFLLILREVAAWREIEAQRRNVPRNRVVRDEGLLEIAAQAPKDEIALRALRGMRNEKLRGKPLKALLKAIRQGQELPENYCPIVPHRPNKVSNMEGARELIRVLLKYCSEKNGVAQKLISTSEEIEMVISNPDSKPRPLTGWRGELFGQFAVSVLQGELALTASGSDIKLVKPGEEI